MQQLSDSELMRLVRNRDRAAFEQLYDRYVKLVYSFALKSAKNEQTAKEIVQLVFTRLWTTQSEFDPGKGQFVNWLLTVTRNIAIDHLRKERRQESIVPIAPEQWAQIPDEPHRSPEDALSRKWIREQIREAYHLLSESQVKLIERVYWEGYTLSELARLNDEPIGTIKSRLHQSLKILRKVLAPQKEGT